MAFNSLANSTKQYIEVRRMEHLAVLSKFNVISLLIAHSAIVC